MSPGRRAGRKTFGGTCPECCGDLGVAASDEPKVVCVYCGECPEEPCWHREAERWLRLADTRERQAV